MTIVVRLPMGDSIAPIAPGTHDTGNEASTARRTSTFHALPRYHIPRYSPSPFVLRLEQYGQGGQIWNPLRPVPPPRLCEGHTALRSEHWLSALF